MITLNSDPNSHSVTIHVFILTFFIIVQKLNFGRNIFWGSGYFETELLLYFKIINFLNKNLKKKLFNLLKFFNIIRDYFNCDLGVQVTRLIQNL